MTIALSEDHSALGEVASSLLYDRTVRQEARQWLDGGAKDKPAFWDEITELGWLGLHVPTEHGGSGYTLEELVVLVEELGRACAPGPFVPTAIASAYLVLADAGGLDRRLLAGLATGELTAAVSLENALTWEGDAAPAVSGEAVALVGASSADTLVAIVGEHVAVIEDLRNCAGVSAETPKNLDPARPCSRFALRSAPAIRLAASGRTLLAVSRTILAAEAVGVARECVSRAVEYAKSRVQFGRPIGTFQAVKHHCANMHLATEAATAAVWDAARAASEDEDQRSWASAAAAVLAGAAAELCSNLNIQVHGGIGFTWEHDAHLYLRRAAVLRSMLQGQQAKRELTVLAQRAVQRRRDLCLPDQDYAARTGIRQAIAEIKAQEGSAQIRALVDAGLAVPHWPAPWGRAASAMQQLVIQEELMAAGIAVPQYGITGWAVLTLVQHGTAAQRERWIRPALYQDVSWCQLFSEPDAGSDAAGITTKGTRVDGGWLIAGQKVWTSGAHNAAFGLATVRTSPDKPKHRGISVMVVDMAAEGVEIRPIRWTAGDSEFSEVFLNEVFVPDDDVVGTVDDGWLVARTTLGNESVSIGSAATGFVPSANDLLAMKADDSTDTAIGAYLANLEAVELLNLRRTIRAVAGREPGAEGFATKLLLSELGHQAASLAVELARTDVPFLEGAGELSGRLTLMHRAYSIAGGTSEIKRNQISERILGLPRDPLIGR